jgi:hypothetical protein
MVTEYSVLFQLKIKIGISKFYDMSDIGLDFHSHHLSFIHDGMMIIKTKHMAGTGILIRSPVNEEAMKFLFETL